MPIQKFKSFQEAEEALWCFRPNMAYYQSLRQFWDTIARLHPLKKYPHGITRYKSTVEADQKMDEWLSTP